MIRVAFLGFFDDDHLRVEAGFHLDRYVNAGLSTAEFETFDVVEHV